MIDLDVGAILNDLPSDPHDALVEASSRIERSLNAAFADDQDFQTAATMLMRLAREFCDIDLRVRENVTWQQDFERFGRIVQEERRRTRMDAELTDHIDRFKKRTDMFGLAKLSPDEKAFIRKKIEGIRGAIDSSSLELRKRNAIIKRLTELEKEVGLDGSRLDNALALVIDLTVALKKGHMNLKGLIDDAKDIAGTMIERQAADEGVALPKPDRDKLAAPHDPVESHPKDSDGAGDAQ